MGPTQSARHIVGGSAHELSDTARRYVTVDKLNKAIADIVNAFMELDLIRVRGDGSVGAADGTQVDTFIDNLLAETSIRYGGTGGIGYYYISDTYIALFLHSGRGVGGGVSDPGHDGEGGSPGGRGLSPSCAGLSSS
ncbi:MAG: transposase [Actinomycetota bacterium]|nr:transposase [Actinomycetota bacterium]